jgi:hypothetical protein
MNISMKKYLVIGAMFLSVVASVLIYFSYKKNNQPESEVMGQYTNSADVENIVSFEMNEATAFLFTIQQDEHNHQLFINITPFLEINVGELTVKKFTIKNFQSDSGIGEVVLIHPTDLEIGTVGRNFLFKKSEVAIQEKDIVAGDGSIEYIVVPEALKFNEINSSNTLTPYFGIILKDIGSVDYKAIKEKDGEFDPSKYIQYANIPYSSLDTDFQFDIHIEFENGTTYKKILKGQLLGELFRTESVPLFDLEVIQ